MLLNDFINDNIYYLDKVSDLRKKHNNIKDFQNMLGYVIMEIVSTEKSFINMKRNNIDLPAMAGSFFERGNNWNS